MKCIKFEEEKLFSKTFKLLKVFWLDLLIILLISFAAMMLAQFSISSYFAKKTVLFILLFLFFIAFLCGSVFISMRFLKKIIKKHHYDKNSLFLTYFILMLATGLLFSGIFLTLEKKYPSIWFLKTSFLGIILMILFWVVLAIVWFSNNIFKKLNH